MSIRATFFLSCLVLSACAAQSVPATGRMSGFEAALQPLCGKAYEGRITTTDAADDDWRAEQIVMHVRTCDSGLVTLPLHIGDDRSRTWVLMQVGDRWELRHDHRHEDGEPDDLTLYGGFASTPADALIQEFPADQATRDLFDQENIPVSKTNIWTVEVDPEAGLFAYQLARPGRLMRLEFNTSRAIDVPPPPSGAAD